MKDLFPNSLLKVRRRRTAMLHGFNCKAAKSATADRRNGGKKNTCLLKDFYADWLDNLRSTLLPLLRQSISLASSSIVDESRSCPVSLAGAMASTSVDVLASNVRSLHAHFDAYFQALDLAAGQDVTQVLSRRLALPLEKPFLFLGDFHPAILTILLRSFLDPSFRSISVPSSSYPFSRAWKDPSRDLIAKVEQIERGLRLIVPTLVQRLRDVQKVYFEAAVDSWVAGHQRVEASSEVPEDVIKSHLRELECIFGDANRLRRSILGEILAAIDVYQAALFLESLSNFVIGYSDEDVLREYEQRKRSSSNLLPL
ncbi:hypothetical protein HPP92_025603 [Vanilla planifolia]|uniref:DOG1 domain-containing protein n=1 Tax=Vanilla planifolia TaxID=51239 RepID=A0A835PJJ0_VANPL|nr:hypothetical protein HPP92_025603 [Vanilla planifolia]